MDLFCMLQYGGHHRLDVYARRGQEPKDEVSINTDLVWQHWSCCVMPSCLLIYASQEAELRQSLGSDATAEQLIVEQYKCIHDPWYLTEPLLGNAQGLRYTSWCADVSTDGLST